MAISFHFREPFIPDIIVLISFILFLVGSTFIKKDNTLKRANLLIIGSIIAILWYVTDFFIPGIYLPITPTPEDLEFTRVYGTIFTGIVPGFILIMSLGIMPLAIFFTNRSSNSIFVLALGAIIQILSIVVGFDLYNPLISAISLTATAISMGCFAYYGYKSKNFFLSVFALSFFIGRLLYLIMM